MKSGDIIIFLILGAIAYFVYLIYKSPSKGLTPGMETIKFMGFDIPKTIPATPTLQLIDPCAINPLAPQCIAAGLYNTIPWFGNKPSAGTFTSVTGTTRPLCSTLIKIGGSGACDPGVKNVI